MTATSALTTDLQRQVLLLEDDLRARVGADAGLEGRWKTEHQRARDKERTAASWVAWRDDRVTQAAVAWVLTTVFVRFCEDNALVAPVWIAGPENRRQEALDAQLAFFRTHPDDTDREWLQAAIGHLAALPATKALVDSHSALHLVSPSGNAVTALLDFWRRRSEDGALVHDLADSSLSHRFLGDLYQDLSQHAKDIYALLQTPVFVEEFILDRTLEPALKERPLEGFRLIDPTCGSGHFLLGAFDRLLDRWNRYAPGLETQARVQAALDAIHGVDLNPFAVAIARFRLTVAALKASSLTSLEAAPAFTFHLAVGDSLIHGPDPDVLPGMTDRSAFMPFTYATEDGPLLLTVLEEGRYDVVVGNPPYITPKDKALNQIYRSKYANVCKGTYALTAPFMALFFALAKRGEQAGWVGQITSNSFMKREFGTKLIEDFLAYQDLRLVADTSGAYIPGHGTPTVIIVGRNQQPVSSSVRTVLGVRGEPGRPGNPAKGIVWTSITEHVDHLGWNDGWVTIADLDRTLLNGHPWSLTGGGAVTLLGRLNDQKWPRLSTVTVSIGRVLNSVEDSMLIWDRKPVGHPIRPYLRPVVDGSRVRDYNADRVESVIYGYDQNASVLHSVAELFRYSWPYRTSMNSRLLFSRAISDRGLPPWALLELYPDRATSSRLVAFAMVATHNHFVLLDGEVLARHSAPVIKLREGATKEDHFSLLGVLNSSTACFWLKQVSHDKGNGGYGGGIASEDWERFYEFTGTTLHGFPLALNLPTERARSLDKLAQELSANAPSSIIAGTVPTIATLAEAREASERALARMINIQEELDWEVYGLYGLTENDMTYVYDDWPELALGERAFEIALARAVMAEHQETQWFTRHGSTPITRLPAHWPTEYRDLVQRRLDLIAVQPVDSAAGKARVQAAVVAGAVGEAAGAGA